jgi:hypothetical protein
MTGDRWLDWEDWLILENLSRPLCGPSCGRQGRTRCTCGRMGYKLLAEELGRTRDSVRSRYRELTGAGRDTRRDNRTLGCQQDGWYSRHWRGYQ